MWYAFDLSLRAGEICAVSKGRNLDFLVSHSCGKTQYYLLKHVSINIHLLIIINVVIIGITHLNYILAIMSFAIETIVSITDCFIYQIAGVSLPITENLIPRGIM